MLSQQTYGSVHGAFDYAIDLLGVPADWTSTKHGDTGNFVVGFASVGKTDQDLVNAYGIAGKIITAKISSFKGTAPEKFDSFVIKGEKFIAAAVHPIPMRGEVIGYKIMTNGK